MTKKKMVGWALLAVVCGFGGWQGIAYAIRQWPVKTPADAEGLRTSALGIIRGKCGDCHDASSEEPMSLGIPVVGGQLREKRDRGCRHWDIFDRGWLGKDVTEEQRLASAVPQGPLVKLENVLGGDSMPPAQYRFAHWGTSLSDSERDLLSAWVKSERAAWLTTLGIVTGIEEQVQPLPRGIEHDKSKVKRLAGWPETYMAKSGNPDAARANKTPFMADSRFDHFLGGDVDAIDELQKVGWGLFRRYNCTGCHAGPALGGQSFEHVDLKADYFEGRKRVDADKGLAAFSGKAADEGRFRVPVLRNVELVAPYFHDGRQAKLADAVRSMLTYTVGVETNEAETVALVSFLKSLTGTAAGKPVRGSQWDGKRVAFLGDSITDPRQKNRIYWQFLEERLGIKPLVYAVSGYQWHQMLAMAEKLKSEQGDKVDAIIVFAGTNDFNGDVPLGEWWRVAVEEVNRDGVMTKVKRRRFSDSMDTVRGRINKTLGFIKANFPGATVVLLTPLHRGFAKFSEKNVQPDETCANRLGLWIDDYVKVVREAGSIWSVPVIDLFAEGGLYPNESAYARYFRDNGGNDLLHPNSEGHERLADMMLYRLLTLPAGGLR